MRILILGATGFIGKFYLKNKFIDHSIFIISKKFIKNKNKFPNNYYFYQCDLFNIKRFRKLIMLIKPNICVDLSWQGIPNYSATNNRINFVNKKNLYQILAKNNCKKIISIGSCWEYGNLNCKVSENFKGSKLINFAKVKLNILNYLKKLRKDFKITYIWARVFYVYGPGNKKTALLQTLIRSFEEKKKFFINNPYVSNDYIYVDDVAKALQGLTLKNINSGIYNIGSGKLSSNSLILIKAYNFLKKKYFHKKILEEKPIGLCANIKKIRLAINFRPKISISKGIIHTIKNRL